MSVCMSFRNITAIVFGSQNFMCFHAPNFEEVWEAYWFGRKLGLSVCLSVCYTCTRSRTGRDRILKFGM